MSSPAKKTKAARLDGLMNAVAGFGDASRDKREATEIVLEIWDQDSAEELWRADGFFARIVEKPPKAMTRRGWDVLVKGDKAASEAMRNRQEELQIRQKIRQALCYQRAFGGGALLLGINDGQTWEKPLRTDRIRAFDYVTALTPKELVPDTYERNPLKENYGEPTVFKLRRKSGRARGLANVADEVRVHASRLAIFKGTEVVKGSQVAHVGWGDSIFNRVYAAARDFVMGNAAAAILVADFSQAVYKIKGLAELIRNNEDEVVKNRAILVDFMRSVARAILVDSEESFERVTTPVDGLPDLLDRFALHVASILDWPLTVLMGQSPAGLNATGESDIRNWYDSLAGDQEDILRTPLELITRYLFIAENGPTEGKEPETWQLKFRNLWTPTAKEEAEIRSTMATADANYVNAGVLMPEEVAQARFGGDEFSIETTLDEGIRREYEAAQEEEDELTREQREIELQAARAAGGAARSANRAARGRTPAGEGGEGKE